MKLFNLIVLVLAAVAMMMGGAQAAPKGGGGGVKSGLKAIGKGLRVVGAIGTGHELYQAVKNRHQG